MLGSLPARHCRRAPPPAPGTEQGVGREPAPTFSPCYAGPFLVWHPLTYATRLAERLAARGSHTQAWLLNTGEAAAACLRREHGAAVCR